MTDTRRLVLAAVAALPLVLGGCGAAKCPTTNPKIAAGGVPTCTGAAAVQAGAPVTVKLNVCPRCDQAYDTCTVTLPDASDTVTIQLDPLVQICEPSNSCPTSPPSSCAVVNCTFQAPAVGTYQLLVNDPDSALPIQRPFEVVAGGATSCSG